MTASYELPLIKKFKVFVRSPEVDPNKIAVIIPVFNDWDGLRVTLESLLNLHSKPWKIAVVNDNEDEEIPNWLSEFPVHIENYKGNRGPAYARNIGFGLREKPPAIDEQGVFSQAIIEAYPEARYPETRSLLDKFYDNRLKCDKDGMGRSFWLESETDWYYFTDCGCKHDENLFQYFAEARHREGDSTVAVCGSTSGWGNGKINRYMTSQRILDPPLENYLYGKKIPQSIITANTLVYGLAFSYINGFSIDFTEAAGEDLDLGIRLREMGFIAYEPRAKVFHEFQEDLSDFERRFKRYGKGNRLLELRHNLPSLRPTPFQAELAEFQDLADLQVKCMQEGYDSVHRDSYGVLYEYKQ